MSRVSWAALLLILLIQSAMLVFLYVENQNLRYSLANALNENRMWRDLVDRMVTAIRVEDKKYHCYAVVEENGTFVLRHWVGEIENGTIVWKELKENMEEQYFYAQGVLWKKWSNGTHAFLAKKIEPSTWHTYVFKNGSLVEEYTER